MPHQIKVTDELFERLKARAGGQPIPKLIRALLDEEDFRDDELIEKLDSGELIDPLLDGLESYELPECCQKIYDDEKPMMKNCCKHWVKAYQNWYGRQILTYKNTLTGGYYNDYVQEYLA